MMSRYTFSQEDHIDPEIQIEIDRIEAAFAQGWWMAKTAFFMLLYIVVTLLYGASQVGAVVVSLIFSIASFSHAIFSGLKLLSKMGLDWLKSRPELQQWNVR